jgi:hypothetical protein
MSIPTNAANADKKLRQNFEISDPLVNLYAESPGLAFETLLKKQGQNTRGSDPFTRFLTRSLGSKDALDTVFNFFAPATAGSHSKDKLAFADQLIQSFYPQRNQGVGQTQVRTGSSAPFGANLADYGTVGNQIRTFLEGGQSTRASMALGGMTAAETYSAITGLIDTVAPFTMDDLQAGMIVGGLRDMITDYYAFGHSETGKPFGQYLLESAGKWLNIWWNTGDVTQADTAFYVSEQERAERERVAAAKMQQEAAAKAGQGNNAFSGATATGQTQQNFAAGDPTRGF